MDHTPAEQEQEGDLESIQAQIDLSMSLAYDLVSTWMNPRKDIVAQLPPLDSMKELEEYSRRPARLGVGAPIPSNLSTFREVSQLKNKLSSVSRKRGREHEVESTEKMDADDSDENEEESRAGVLAKRAKIANKARTNLDRMDESPPSPNKKKKKKKKKNIGDDPFGSPQRPSQILTVQMAENSSSVSLAAISPTVHSPNTQSSPQKVGKPSNPFHIPTTPPSDAERLDILPIISPMKKDIPASGPTEDSSDSDSEPDSPLTGSNAPLSPRTTSDRARSLLGSLPLLNLKSLDISSQIFHAAEGPSQPSSPKKKKKRRKKRKKNAQLAAEPSNAS